MTNEDLHEYINKFYYHQRDEIYKMILDSQLLEDAFQTKGGEVVFQSAIESIASNVMKLVNICANKTAEDASKLVYPIAIAIDAMHKTILNWSDLIEKGKEHKRKAENQD